MILNEGRQNEIATKQVTVRKYLNIEDIQKEYLPLSKKKLRAFTKKYLNVKIIGNRMFVEREQLEKVLSSDGIFRVMGDGQ